MDGWQSNESLPNNNNYNNNSNNSHDGHKQQRQDDDPLQDIVIEAQSK